MSGHGTALLGRSAPAPNTRRASRRTLAITLVCLTYRAGHQNDSLLTLLDRQDATKRPLAGRPELALGAFRAELVDPLRVGLLVGFVPDQSAPAPRVLRRALPAFDTHKPLHRMSASVGVRASAAGRPARNALPGSKSGRSSKTCAALCEHPFVTSQGSPMGAYGARSTPATTIALAAAADLDYVSLPDALELVLLLVDDPKNFRRAALRWHARYCGELPDVGYEEAHAVLACLAGLAGRRPKPAGCARRACQSARP